MGTTEKLKDDNEKLNLIKERERLADEIKAMTAPWWRKGTTFAAIGSLLSVLVTLAAGAMSSVEKYWTLRMQEAKQQHDIATQREKQTEEIRNAYLDRLKDADSRQRTLRFLSMTAADDKVRNWARDELALVEKETKRLEEELAAAKTEAAAARKAAREEAQKAKANAHEVAESRRRVQELDKKIVQLEAQRRGTSSVLFTDDIWDRKLSWVERCSQYSIKTSFMQTMCKDSCRKGCKRFEGVIMIGSHC
jgi:murein DD-endopeptidase MepM/ murein hydrolase activator NlpD